MIVTPYGAKLTGIEFGKICLSPPSRYRGVHALFNNSNLVILCSDLSDSLTTSHFKIDELHVVMDSELGPV